MNFAKNVDKDFIDLVLESALWQKNGVVVNKNASLNEDANEYEEPSEMDVLEDEREEDTFSMDDLEYVLNHMEDTDLMEHAESMLNVFDQAEQALLESEDPGDEDEEDVEAEEEAEEEAEDALVSEAILNLLAATRKRS